MTSTEYKARRTALGHTQQSLANVLGLARGTIARRETGVIAITPEAEIAILGLKKHNDRSATFAHLVKNASEHTEK